MKSKLIQVNIPAKDIGKIKSFYSRIVGHLEFARSLSSQVTSYHVPISKDGLQLTITQRHSAQEPPVCYFSVENLSSMIETLTSAGATVLVEPFNLPVAPQVLKKYSDEFRKNHKEEPADSVGRSAILRDPEGNVFGLTELHEHAHWLFKVGRYHEGLDAEQMVQHERGIALGKELETK
jgi:predicted enzyme related to lactoylglutathione lyase